MAHPDHTEQDIDFDDTPRTQATQGSGFVESDEQLEPSDEVGQGFAAPADLSGLSSGHTWAEAEYAIAGFAGSAMDKLLSSAVAPLVALARGYQVVNASNVNEVFDQAKMTNDRDRRANKRTMVSTGVQERDGLAMPWYGLADLTHAAQTGMDPDPTEIQFRPSDPRTAGGRPMKYVFRVGARTPLDLHPSTPLSWAQDSEVTVLIAEGLLKGDAALSAWLHTHTGHPLTVDEDSATPDAARAKVAKLMEQVPVEHRVLIVRSTSSTTMMRDSATWQVISFRDRDVWLGFDGDVVSNPSVWSQARKVYDRLLDSDRAHSVALLIPSTTEADASTSKEGLDDWLAKYGTWTDLVSHCLVTDFPDHPAPDTEGVAEGEWRVSPDGTRCEEMVFLRGEDREVIKKTWVPTSLPIGGRLVAGEIYREPSEAEVASGQIDSTITGDQNMVTVEISWDLDGSKYAEEITGPAEILGMNPDQWRKEPRVEIPMAVLELPKWPPYGPDGRKFMEAIKAHRRGDVTRAVRWNRMGWVPVENEMPAYIVGTKVIDATGRAADSCRIGFGQEKIHNFHSFGIGGWDPDEHSSSHNFEDPVFRQRVRVDLITLMDAMVFSGAWTRRGVAEVLVCAGLRPIIPFRPKVAIYIHGAKGKGKSWSAQKVMAFWASGPTAWVDSLPGSASDSKASMENALAHAPLWVIDDLAPSVSDRAAKQAEQAVEDLIRDTFNGHSRSRMRQDMTTRHSPPPMGQLVVTAENLVSTPSARERSIPVEISKGSLHESHDVTRELDAVLARDGVAPRMTAHLVRYMLHRAAKDGGWDKYHAWLGEAISSSEERARQLMVVLGGKASDLTRSSRLAADATASMHVIGQMAKDLAQDCLDPVQEEKLWRIARLWSWEEDGVLDRISELVYRAHEENVSLAPGRAVITAVSKLLASGRAHVRDPERVGSAPFVAGESSGSRADALESTDQVNSLLGWEMDSEGTWRARGTAIGSLVRLRNGDPVVLLDEENAFNEAKRHYETLVIPGQKKAAAWSGVWTEGLNAKSVTPQLTSGGTRRNTWRHRGKGFSVSGVPVDLDILLGLDGEADEQELEQD